MEKRYEGFLAPHGLYILDTQSGEVRFISNVGDIQSSIGVGTSLFDSKAVTGSLLSSQNQLSSFENEVISSYPYLIAKPFADLIKEKDARLKCKLMVDTFTAVLKYMALQLASEYIRAKDVKDIQVHQTLTKDLARPLISAWNLLITRCLPVLNDNKVLLFSPELKDAYEKLETNCKDPFLVSQTYSDENGEIKTRTKKLGKIQALINYRNGLAHGFNQSLSRAQKEFDEYYPLLYDILQEVRFVSRYTLWHVESSRQGVNGIRLMGTNPEMKKVEFSRDGVNPAISPLFLINDASGEILPLYAFFDVDNTTEDGLPELGKDVFVFEGNTKNTVIYLSSSGEHLEKSSRFQHWKELLGQKQFEVEWVEAKNLSLNVLHAIGIHNSSSGIQALISSAKYLREATISRQDLNEMLDSFSSGNYNGFVLGGESGIGKSTLLAQKTEEWQGAGHMVTFYRGSALNQSDITNKFLRDCALKVSYFEDFLSIVNPLFAQTNKKCYLIIDALNEYAGNLNELIQSIENAVAQAVNFPWFKLIVSIRDSAYNRTISKFGEIAASQYFMVEEDKGIEKVMTNIIRLKPVPKDFVEQLYNAYRDYKWKESSDAEGYFKFRPLTLFSELNPEGSTVQLIRSPLMARMIMQAFHRAKLPQQLGNDEAMRIYLDNIVLEKTDDNPGFPERKKVINLLVSELDKHSIERLDRDSLLNLPVFRPYLINTQKDSSYIQLLDLGVLMEEWDGENCYVRFVFDKFLEFLLAELHWPRINDAVALLNFCKRARDFKILQGAIEIILIRFCLNNHHDLLVELIDLADNEVESTQSFIKDIGVRTLLTLCNENKNIFEEVIAEFPKTPGALDLVIMKDLLDKLFISGNLTGFEKVMTVAIEEADLLNDKKTLSDLILSQAILDGLQGRIEDALSSIEKAIVIKQEINDAKGYFHCLRLKGIRFKFLGKLKEAEELFLESLDGVKRLNDDNGISSSLHNLGTLYKDQGKIEEAEKLFLESLEIKRKLGDKKGISNSLLSIGILYKNQDKIKEAEKLYLESLVIKRQLGDKNGISMCLNNLGVLNRNQGKLEGAKKMYIESLDIKRQLGDKRGISICLGNLGVLSFEAENFEDAKKYYSESLRIRQELKDLIGVIGVAQRAFSLMEENERAQYYNEISKTINQSTAPNQLSSWANIELMQYCLSSESIDISLLREKFQNALQLKNKSTLNDIDDLPVEAFYCAVMKLIECNELDFAKEVANQALTIIANSRSIRKKYFLQVLN
jgi:tetratricopeptide (TPR) repeat protein